jgi:excisionase family DNA binding protein
LAVIEFERKPYYSPAELAAILGVHRATIDRYIRDGRLRAVKLSARAYRIPLGAVLRLVAPEELPAIPHPVLSEEAAADALSELREEGRSLIEA